MVRKNFMTSIGRIRWDSHHCEGDAWYQLVEKHGVEWNAMAVVNDYNADYPLDFTASSAMSWTATIFSLPRL